MNSLVNIVVSAPKKLKRDDDWVDRLSHRYTVIILVVFAGIIKASLWVGTAITCWVPKHFTGSHTTYANAYCWVRNTYYLAYEEEIPKEHEEEKRHTILYYQWMPFILMGQAILFFLPSAIWHAFNQRAGVDCDNILDSASQFSNAEKAAQRERLLLLISNQMDRFLGARRSTGKGQMSIRNAVSRTCCLLCGRRTGSYLVALYMFVKLLYIANIFFQLAILNDILRTSFLVYGVEFINNVWFDDYWVNSKTFPRVTMCDFNVRRLGNVQRYTVQCVLPINMYTEKVYAFLWFWFFFLLAMTILNTFMWILRFICRSDRVQYIRNHLRLANVLDTDPRSLGLLREFVCDYLQQDGVFVMRLIGHNTNNITVTEIIGALYTKFCEKRRKKDDDFPRVDNSSAPPMENEKKPLTYPELPPN